MPSSESALMALAARPGSSSMLRAMTSANCALIPASFKIIYACEGLSHNTR